MSIDSEADLKGMKDVSRVAAIAREALVSAAVVGMTPRELDELCGRIFREYGAESAPRLVYGAPVNAFISVNDVIVHGLPTERPFKPGDVVKIDVTPILAGYVSDTATTKVLEPGESVAVHLADCAREAFYSALAAVRPGNRVREIGRRIDGYVRSNGFSVVRSLSGHGVGRSIHEKPSIPNYEEKKQKDRILLHAVLAIEPMIASGSGEVLMRRDGWTIATTDRSLTAHYEHTVLVQDGEPLILTA
jgi:methionyl aminopeptidase